MIEKFNKFKTLKILGVEVKVPFLLGFLVVGIFITGVAFSSYSQEINEDISSKLIRLHVIANSDSKEDQSLKRKVRDEILSYMRKEFDNSQNVDQSKQLIKRNMENIKILAKNVVIKNNKDYDVKVVFSKFPFPTKKYGDIVLPAGEYQALRVVIGNGDGANWWCVMFPPLCFVDATHGTIPSHVKSGLKSKLTKEEYKLVDSSENEIPIKIKFKLVEAFQSSKIKVKCLISRRSR